MRKYALFLFALVLFSAGVLADDFAVSIEPMQRFIKIGDAGVFNLTITHSQASSTGFEVFSSDVVWDLRTKDALIVPPGPAGLKTELYIRPLYLVPGFYGVPISIRLAGTNQVVTKNLVIELGSSTEPITNYLPAVRGNVQIAPKVDPQEPVELSVNLESQNKLAIAELDIKVRSNLINTDLKTKLDGLEKKIVRFNITFDPYTPPQHDTLRVSMFAYDTSGKAYEFDAAPVEYDVVSYGDISVKKSVQSQFLKDVTTVVLENTGNVPKQYSYSFYGTFFKNFFTKANPAAVIQGNTYSWGLNFNIGERKEIVITTNYWPIMIIAVILALILVAYFVFRSPIVLFKRARVVTTKEGGISLVKIILNVSNRSTRRINHIRIIDLVPTIGDYVKEVEMGSVVPVKVFRHEKKGTVVKWEIDSLEPGEEAIITYKMRSHFAILGGVSLPAASAKFVSYAGKEQSVNSNVAITGFR